MLFVFQLFELRFWIKFGNWPRVNSRLDRSREVSQLRETQGQQNIQDGTPLGPGQLSFTPFLCGLARGSVLRIGGKSDSGKIPEIGIISQKTAENQVLKRLHFKLKSKSFGNSKEFGCPRLAELTPKEFGCPRLAELTHN